MANNQNVYQNKKTGIYYWKIQLPDGSFKKRENKDWIRPSYAKRDLEQFLKNVKNNEEPIKRPTFKYVCEMYLERSKFRDKQSTHLRNKQMLEKYLIPFFNNMKIFDITVQDIDRFQRDLLSKTYVREKDKVKQEYKLRNSYIEKIQGSLRLVFDYAQIYGYVTKNVVRMATIVRRRELETKKTVKIITHEQFKDFLAVITDQTDRTMYSILYWCGLRYGEMAALSIHDFSDNQLEVNKNYDTKNHLITTTKTELNRTVDVPDKCADEINLLLKEYKEIPHDDNCFLIGITNPRPKTTVERRKNEYIENANKKISENNALPKNKRKQHEPIPYFTFHELRHTHVSLLISLNLKDEEIAERLGHSVEMVNNTYGHLFPKKKKEILNKLNKII